MTTTQTGTPFTPTHDDMNATYNGIGVTEFEEGDAIALTSDPQLALSVFQEHLRAQDDDTADDDLDINIRRVTFRRPPENDDYTWYVDDRTTDDPHTITVAWLEV